MHFLVQILTRIASSNFLGLNKGRPDAEDLIRAEEFARNLKGEPGEK
jgi:hypothetical protein